MKVRTHVSATVRNDRLDDVVSALKDVDPNVIVTSANRTIAAGTPAGLAASLTGDVREAVKKQLEAFPELQCRIEVVHVEDL